MMRKILLGGAILASLFASSAQADTTYDPGSKIYLTDTIGLADAINGLFGAGHYTNLIKWFAAPGNLNHSGVALTGDTVSLTASDPNFLALLGSLAGGTSGLSLSIGFTETAIDNANAKLQLTSFTYGANGKLLGGALADGSTVTVAVPGPLAGAGLPFLAALAALAIGRRRREATAF